MTEPWERTRLARSGTLVLHGLCRTRPERT